MAGRCGPGPGFRRVPRDYGRVEGPGGRGGGFSAPRTEAGAPAGASSGAAGLCHPSRRTPHPFPAPSWGREGDGSLGSAHLRVCPEAALPGPVTVPRLPPRWETPQSPA